MTNPLPLWRQMENSFLRGRHPGYSDRHGYAGELRVIADVIEARGERGEDLDPGEVADWLRAEAERAEGGDA